MKYKKLLLMALVLSSLIQAQPINANTISGDNIISVGVSINRVPDRIIPTYIDNQEITYLSIVNKAEKPYISLNTLLKYIDSSAKIQQGHLILSSSISLDIEGELSKGVKLVRFSDFVPGKDGLENIFISLDFISEFYKINYVVKDKELNLYKDIDLYKLDKMVSEIENKFLKIEEDLYFHNTLGKIEIPLDQNIIIRLNDNNPGNIITHKDLKDRNILKILNPNTNITRELQFSKQSRKINNENSESWYFSQRNTGNNSDINCGPASTAMIKHWLKNGENLDNLTPPERNRFVTALSRELLSEGGTPAFKIKNYLEEYGFKNNLQYKRIEDFETIKEEIDKGNIILITVDSNLFYKHSSERGRMKHYIIVHGYDLDKNQILIQDSWERNNKTTDIKHLINSVESTQSTNLVVAPN